MNNEKNSLFPFILFMMMLIVVINLGFEFYLKNKVAQNLEIAIKEKQPPVYNLFYIKDKSCKDCFPIEIFGKKINDGVSQVTINENFVDSDSDKGNELINKYKIDKLPSLVITGDIKKNNDIYQFLDKTGDVTDEDYVLRVIQPVYYDIKQDEYIGRFSVHYISTPDCEECYDVSLHKSALEGLLLIPNKEKLIDYRSEEAQELIKKHNITKVPTIVLQGTLGKINKFNQIWENYGTIEDDVYIFREMEEMGKYYDLVEKKVKGTNKD